MQATKKEDGASAVEYGLLIAGVAALIAAIVFIFGDMINDLYGGTCTNVADASNPSAIVSC